MRQYAARAKINLFLDVKEKRPDGYHEVCTVLQSVDLADDIRVSPGGGAPTVNYRDCPTCDFHDDLIIKAWQALLDATGNAPPFSAEVTKRIPVAAGLGGGSADAAAGLVAFNDIFSLGLSSDDLREIAARVGADVPFFIDGGAAVGRGAGELLEPAPVMPDCNIVLIKPPVDIATDRAYKDLDGYSGLQPLDEAPILAALASNDYQAVCRSIGNSFEPVVFERHPEIEVFKAGAIAEGADAACLSGSGSTVFALTRDKEAADRIAAGASAAGAKVFQTKPCDKAIVEIH
jgi:4-diphosphocytidyl-2-C-methyl-D-erythritol kinase